MSKGLWMNSSAPTSFTCWWSMGRSRTLIMIMGVFLKFFLLFSSLHTSSPLIPGITTSSIIRSGWVSTAFTSASSPVVAVVTL